MSRKRISCVFTSTLLCRKAIFGLAADGNGNNDIDPGDYDGELVSFGRCEVLSCARE
jgi:hypothetical protein